VLKYKWIVQLSHELKLFVELVGATQYIQHRQPTFVLLYEIKQSSHLIILLPLYYVHQRYKGKGKRSWHVFRQKFCTPQFRWLANMVATIPSCHLLPQHTFLPPDTKLTRSEEMMRCAVDWSGDHQMIVASEVISHCHHLLAPVAH